MADQAGCAGKQGDALERGEREADVEHDSGNRAVDVDRQGPAQRLGQGVADCVEHGDMAPRYALLLRERDKLERAGIARRMLRVAEAGNGLLLRAQLANARERRFGVGEALVGRAPNQFRVEVPGQFGAAQHHRSAAEQPCGDSALPGFRACRERHARGDHAGDEAMFGDRAQRRICEEKLYVRRRLAGDEQPEIAGEVPPADDILTQVQPAHRDARLVRCADGCDGIVLLADAHDPLPPMADIAVAFGLRST
jgi:hypothetical protein